MSYLRSEYEDKSLKKNAFSGRRLKMELEKLDSQREQAAKQFRLEKGQLQRQLAEGEQIIKLKVLDPDNIRPLSSVDLKKLSPNFARKLSGPSRIESSTAGGSMLPQIPYPSSDYKFNTTKQSTVAAQVESRQWRESASIRRSSLPPIITVHEPVEQTGSQGGDLKKSDKTDTAKLLQRRRSANNIKYTDDSHHFTSRINEFLEKIQSDSRDRKGNEIEQKK